MYIIMLGAPGTGKGTIGKEICKKFDLSYLSTGDMFREEIKNQTELGKKAQQQMNEGGLVSDDITINMVKNKLDNLKDVLLDGFPRTIKQADALKQYLAQKGEVITAVINLIVPEQDLIKRTSSRVICSNKECGAAYNTIFMPPKVEGICDKCGSPLIKRKDDEPETIKERLQVYSTNTQPLIDYYINQNLLEKIDIDIYVENTKEITTNKAIEIIKNRM